MASEQLGTLANLSKSALVERAERILDGRRIPPEQTSQLRNMVQITQAETEVPVLVNFIRYQMGRKGQPSSFWEVLGPDVITTLNEINSLAGGDAAARKSAIQNFFGFLVRHYVYLSATRKGQPRPDQGGPRRQQRERR